MRPRDVRLAAVILTCWIIGCAVGDTPVKPPAPSTEPVDPTEAETVWYDVRDLITFVPIDPDEKTDGSADLGANALLKIIRDEVDRDSWQDNGGAVGKVTVWCGDFIITQTPAAHAQIKQLLEKLRALGRRHETSVSVDAYWVRLTPAQLAAGDSAIAPSVLADANSLYARARLTGFEGQRQTVSVNRTVAVVSGITSFVLPGGVGYEPQVNSKESEVIFSEIPRAAADREVSIFFDSKVSVQPESGPNRPVTRPSTEPSNAVGPMMVNAANEVAGSATAVIHTRSIVQLKLGVPTIVSGMSDHPGAGDNRTLCLVLCATVTR
jgi:hypothetical protein